MAIDELEVERFLFESNKIEEIYLVSTSEKISAFHFMEEPRPIINRLEDYVHSAHDASTLREWENMNKSKGLSLNAPPSGPAIREHLSLVLTKAGNNLQTPFELHCEFMALSPFVCGNGQAGRLLWFWQMIHFYPKRGRDSFLSSFYRQALEAC